MILTAEPLRHPPRDDQQRRDIGERQSTAQCEDDEVACRIRALRKGLGLSQTQFGAYIGVHYATVNRWENGRSKPAPIARKLIALLEKEGMVLEMSGYRVRIKSKRRGLDDD